MTDLVKGASQLKGSLQKLQLISSLERLSKLDKQKPGFQDESEQSSLHLNRHFLPDKFKLHPLYQGWLKFPTSSDRSDSAAGLQTRCIENPDIKFEQFIKTFRPLLLQLFHNFQLGQDLLRGLDKVDFLPAGKRSLFGASADYSKEKSRICINPEESTPFLFAKLMHELTHALNDTSRTLLKSFNQKIKEWNQVSSLVEASETLLYDFESNFNDSEQNLPDTDSMMESFRSQSKIDLKSVMNLLSSKKQAYKDPKTQIRQHSSLFVSWHEAVLKKKSENQALIESRKKLDQERFIDEHRAYLIEYQAAVFLVQESPEFYCRLWAPSFAKGRPALYYETYRSLEEKFFDGKFSEWLADLYTNKSNSYMPESIYIYQNGKNQNIILPDLLKIISTLFPAIKPPVQKDKH